MSCRRCAYSLGSLWIELTRALRGERARFIGCHVGSPSLSGCGNGCCHSWGSEGIEENERVSYLTGWAPTDCRWPKSPSSKHPHRCAVPGRPKYACFSCRRTFKPALIDGNEYEDTSFLREEWIVRPGRESKKLQAVWRAQRKLQGQQKNLKTDDGQKLLADMRDAIDDFIASAHEATELTEELKAIAPELWWKRLGSRCPGCGGDGRPVGSTFRAPKQSDVVGWRDVHARIEAGDEFRFCATKSKRLTPNCG